MIYRDRIHRIYTPSFQVHYGWLLNNLQNKSKVLLFFSLFKIFSVFSMCVPLYYYYYYVCSMCVPLSLSLLYYYLHLKKCSFIRLIELVVN